MYRWCLLILACAGCGPKHAEEAKPADFDSAAVAARCVAQYDANKNGALEFAEVAASPGLTAAFAAFDSDRSNSISLAELTARFEIYKSKFGGTVPVAVYVALDNSPLEGAVVTFEPESFLADHLKTVSGTTDPNGRCVEFASGSTKLNGMTAGIYKIKVTKDGADIPVRFNTATTLGREIMTDGRAGEVAITLDLTAR